jgi:hypothetical protein
MVINRVFLLAAFVGPAMAEVVLAPGTELHVRLQTAVSSATSEPGQPAKAVVIAPVVVGGLAALPAGAALYGAVAAVKHASTADEHALLDLQFTKITAPDGQQLDLPARIIEIDNARETVDEAGRIVGIIASETLAARVDQGIGKVGERNQGLANILDVARSVILTQKPSGEIRYEPGVELTLRLTQPFRWPGEPQERDLEPVGDREALSRLVNSQPLRTVAEKPPKPSDLTNLMFIGSDEALEATFKQAGWSIAHKLNAESALETVRAIAELRGYKEAPMSRLLLNGKPSDFDMQKGNNTFEKRHHLRIWRMPETWNGKPVWVSAATHDIGIELSESNATFIHVIDSRIDTERAKVVNDLVFTGRVKSVELVERPQAPRETTNATGDRVETDGRMAVVILD